MSNKQKSLTSIFEIAQKVLLFGNTKLKTSFVVENLREFSINVNFLNKHLLTNLNSSKNTS